MKDLRPLITSGFGISGRTLDPRHCTQAIGIDPTEVGLVGTKRTAKSWGKLTTSFWSVHFEKVPSESLDDGLTEVINVVWPRRNEIVSYIANKEWSASFFSSVTFYGDPPLYSLGPETLKRMSFFGVEYGLDIYDYSDQEESV